MSNIDFERLVALKATYDPNAIAEPVLYDDGRMRVLTVPDAIAFAEVMADEQLSRAKTPHHHFGAPCVVCEPFGWLGDL